MYIGPVDKSDRTVWYSMKSPTMVKRDISFSSALMKIVDESERVDRVAHNNTPQVFHNVKDPHRHRRRRLISIMNDGDGISSAVHAATQTTPQLVLVNS
jgi:hypothetical protein